MFSSKDYRDNVDHDFQVTGGDIDDMDSDNILDHGNISSLEMAAHDAALTDGLIHPQGMKINENKTKKLGLRRGKWTPEEEYYANRLIQEFKSGLLPLTDGTTLRTFLSKLLNCDPMRISKKFVGQNCIGKQVFRRRQQDLDKLTADQVERSRRELAELERKFLERVAQTNRSKTTSGTVKPIKDSKLYDETTGIVAPWMRQPDDFANDYNNNNPRYPSLLNQPLSSNPQGHNNNIESNLQAILAWPSMTSLINVNVDENINNDDINSINNNKSSNSHSSSDNQQLLSGLSGLQSLSSVALQEFESIETSKSNVNSNKRPIDSDTNDDKFNKRTNNNSTLTTLSNSSNNDDDGYFIGEEENNQSIGDNIVKSDTNNNKIINTNNDNKEIKESNVNIDTFAQPSFTSIKTNRAAIANAANYLKQGKPIPHNSSVENFWMLVQMGDLPRPESGTLTETIWNGGKQGPSVTETTIQSINSKLYSSDMEPLPIDNIKPLSSAGNMNMHVFYNSSNMNNDVNIKQENVKSLGAESDV
eukprot:gene17531-23093_t